MAITRTIEIGKKKKTRTTKTVSGEKKLSGFDKNKLAFVEAVIDSAKKGEKFPWQSPNFLKFPKSLYSLEKIEEYNKKHPDKPKRKSEALYKGMNVLILSMAMGKKGFTDSRWVTMDHVNELGGRIKKDEIYNYTKVITYNPKALVKKKNRETGKWEVQYERDEKTGQFILNEKGEKVPKTMPKTSWRPMYNVQQAEGLNLAPEPPMRKFSENEKVPEMETILANSEAPIILDQGTGVDRYYDCLHDEVHLPPRDMFKSMSAFYATAAHEIGHSTGSEKRLNRDMSGGFGSKKYAREELVAELTSVFLSQEMGVEIPQKELDNHMEYIKSWDSKIKLLTENPDELYRVVADAQKATDYIRTHMLEKDMHKDKVEEIAEEKSEEKVADKEVKKSKGIHRKSSDQTLSR